MSSLSYKGSLDFSHNLVLEGLGKVKELANAKEIILAEALQTFYNRTSLDNSVFQLNLLPCVFLPYYLSE